MRWNKKQKELILRVIENERRMFRKESERENFMSNDCPFCPHYVCDTDCPNFIIAELFDCIDGTANYCYDNARYIGLEFSDLFPRTSKSNIIKRIQFWIDALALTKRKFLKIYKEINAQHKTIPA